MELELPVVLEKVPAGHGVGVETPDGQKPPAGQRDGGPPTVVAPVASRAPLEQRKPAAHTPSGAKRPYAEQTFPAVHGWHSDAEARPVRFPNVPGGQGEADSLPAGQKLRTGQRVGEDGDEPLQKKRAGQAGHELWPVALLAVPRGQGTGSGVVPLQKAPAVHTNWVETDDPPVQ